MRGSTPRAPCGNLLILLLIQDQDLKSRPTPHGRPLRSSTCMATSVRRWSLPSTAATSTSRTACTRTMPAAPGRSSMTAGGWCGPTPGLYRSDPGPPPGAPSECPGWASSSRWDKAPSRVSAGWCCWDGPPPSGSPTATSSPPPTARTRRCYCAPAAQARSPTRSCASSSG